jgi:excisionase family DNA binding protein
MDRSSGPNQALVDEGVRTLAQVWAAAPAEALRLLVGGVATDLRPDAPVSRRDLLITVSVAEAANLLGLSRAATYEAVWRRQLPSVRIGRRILIPTSRLGELLGAQMR